MYQSFAVELRCHATALIQVDDEILYFNERYVRGEFQIMFDELNREILKSELLTTIKQLRNDASAGLKKIFKPNSLCTRFIQ